MSRLLLLAIVAATLAACNNRDGPYGYGYAVNGRPSLSQLSAVAGGSNSPLRVPQRPSAKAK